MTPDGKRYHHQRRLAAAVLRAASRRLDKAPLDRARDFDELHRLVDEVIGSMHGIGALTVYDTALRIGVKLGVKPQRVYLHSGTRLGARVLGLPWRLPYLAATEFPEELRELEPHEIEDCICIFKHKLAASRRSNNALHQMAARVSGRW